MRVLTAMLLSALVCAPAAAQTAMFPARSGESGLLDVPDADVVGVGQGVLASELRLDRRQSDVAFGPLPVYAAAGVTSRIELGLSMRDGGQAGDPVPARMLFGGALKLNLIEGSRAFFSLATDAYVDRMNYRETVGGRFIFSTTSRLPARVAAFVGYERGPDDGPTYGGAFSLAATRETTLILEALTGPRGANYGIALQRRVWAKVPVSLGFNYLPGDEGWRVSLGFAFAPARKSPVTAATEARTVAAPVPAAALAPQFAEDRPHFRLKLRFPEPNGANPRSLRHGPWTATAAAATPGRPAAAASAPGQRAAAPTVDDLADAQLREQEALADARERRVRATSDQLDAREKATQDDARRLADRERELAGREQQLDAREKRIAFRGAPTQQQRDLDALEAQLAAQERNLSAQERSYGPAVDAAQGRERDGAARENAERQEASRLSAAVSGAGSRVLQLEVRKQALGARNRQLGALEARLVAKGERIDALERQLRAKAERIDTWLRRLDGRSERLEVLEQRAAQPKATATSKPADAKPVAGPAKDKAVFVMVVKSPTAIVKERAAVSAGPAGSGAVQRGAAVEKAVAAATIVTFSTPSAELSELDRETIDNIAKLAAQEHCELLIWARAKDPSLMGEAQRRATEIRTRVIAVAQLAEKQIVTRITTRPGAQGVDVVVSALRDSAKPAAPVGPAPAAGTSGVVTLQGGEAGKRQIREAVQAAQPSIEACVADVMEQKKLARAEGSMKLTISAEGKVSNVITGGGDLAGTELAECLSGVSGGWSFPRADAEYVVDVPITVIRGGAR